MWFETLHSANWSRASGISSCAYLLGCFSTGYYLVRAKLGEDIRDLGSGNIGARNVGRVLGKTGFVLTLLCDFGKGALAVWGARHFTSDERIVAMAMIAVVAGHIWPMQLHFRGGKGMASLLGALLVFDPRLALTFAVLFLCLFALLRRTVLPGLFSLACLPLVEMLQGDDHAQIVFISVLAAIVLAAHRKNLSEEFSQLARREADPKPDHPL